jgi:hypothetical protein
MRLILKNISVLVTSLALAFGYMAFVLPTPIAEAAASMSVSAPSSVTVGETINVTINVNTGGSSANSFQFTLSYNGGIFDGVRGTYSGSICSLPITQPDPSGGSASATCGTPSGFNGSGLVATVVLKATSAGSGSLSLSGCQVLANDGHGTDITGGCSGRSITVSEPVNATPIPPTAPPAGGAAATATPKSTAKATPTNKPTPTPVVSQSPKPAETPKTNTAPAATEAPTPPPVQALGATPTPGSKDSSTKATPTPDVEKKTIISSLRNVFSSFGDLKSITKDTTGLAALMIGLVPFLSLTLAIVFFTYRLYLLERRRKRTLDRLFEMELGELASLEGKLDLLAEKGAKGREQYREEFQHAKENILRQLKPDFNKPVEAAKPAKEEAKPAAEEKK